MNEITTDGSVKGKIGGWAAVIRGGRNDEVAGIVKTDDSYTAELMAIYQACCHSGGDFMLISDRKDIVNELNLMMFTEMWTPPLKDKDLWQKIKEESAGKLVSATWQKRNTTPEMRIAHCMASAYATNGR